MADTNRLLELIEDGIVEHGGDLGGWTRREDERLQLFDGRVSLHARLHESEDAPDGIVHTHVFATLHEHDDEVLDACVMGMADDCDAALAQAAMIWITCVAGPIRSFIDGQPVCMTCQAGVDGGEATEGYSPGDYGLPGLRAFVGPTFARNMDEHLVESVVSDSKPWFRYAAESAAPRRVHLAKATVISEGSDGWRRELEIDGHDVSHQDPSWPAGVTGPDFGYLTRFAVFEFPRNSAEIARRAELERTIRWFAEHYAGYESTDELMQAMIEDGFDAELVHETEAISTIAFGRFYLEHNGIQYASTVIRARDDGRIETDVPLMSIPAYTRARALAGQLADTMPEDDFRDLCLYNAESHAILQAVEAHGDDLDLSQVTMFPCVVPDANVSQQTMDAAMAALQELIESQDTPKKRPWWKFW